MGRGTILNLEKETSPFASQQLGGRNWWAVATSGVKKENPHYC